MSIETVVIIYLILAFILICLPLQAKDKENPRFYANFNYFYFAVYRRNRWSKIWRKAQGFSLLKIHQKSKLL